MENKFADKIAIGTTKLGMPYGVLNPKQVVETQVHQLLNKAGELGFNCFDTAPSYGNAEKLLGKYVLPELRKLIITKVAKVPTSTIDQESILAIEDRFQQSLQNMQTQSCYGLLVHDVQDLYKAGAEILVDWMLTLKEKGRVNKIGVSVYTPQEAEELFARFDFDLVQLPYNIFDQRFSSSGTIEQLSKQGVEIHARSLFLKGFLLKSHTDDLALAEVLSDTLIDHHANFCKVLKQQKISAYEACLSFAKAQQVIDRWVVGVSSKDQLQQLVQTKQDPVSNIDFKAWAFNDYAALDPRQW